MDLLTECEEFDLIISKMKSQDDNMDDKKDLVEDSNTQPMRPGLKSDDDYSRAAGCIIMCGDYMLLQQRSQDDVNYPAHFGLFGGSLKKGENSKSGMFREVSEESGITKEDLFDVELIHTKEKNGFTFYTFIGFLNPDSIDNIKIDHESMGYRFVHISKVRDLPLHPEFRGTLDEMESNFLETLNSKFESMDFDNE